MYPETKKMITDKRLGGVYPGVVYSFINQTGEEVVAEGLAQVLDQEITMTTAKRFDVASLTKVVCTTTVLLKLWESGVIAWDDPLQRYLPAFGNSQITIRHLLTHTSDIRTWIPNRDQLDAAGLRAAYLQLEPGADLGRKVVYTDAGTILLGFMLEEIFGGLPVVEIFRKEVLQPLGMHHSIFLPHDEERGDVVPTAKLADGELLKGVTHDPKARVLGEHAGNAGLFSDIGDLLIFSRMLLAKGQLSNGATFLKSSTIQSLLKDQTPDGQGHRSLGWDLGTGGAALATPALFHTGYTGTFLLVDVAVGEAFIFLSNRVHLQDQREAYIAQRDEIIAQYQKERGILKPKVL